MMKRAALFIFLSATFAFCAFGAGEFERLDAIMSKTAKIRAELADARARWQTEKDEKEAALKLYEARLKAMSEKLETLRKANAEALDTLGTIAQKIARDEDFLEKLSQELDGQFAQILADERARAALEKSGDLPKDFGAKSAAEKFRALAAVFEALLTADSFAEVGGETVSTGLFTPAEGKAGGDVSTLKVSRGGKAADE